MLAEFLQYLFTGITIGATYALIALGGGRRSLEDTVDPSVGLQMRVRLGDEVEEGQPLLDLLSKGRGEEEALELVGTGVTIIDKPPSILPELICAQDF